jgi:hypothetical protein
MKELFDWFFIELHPGIQYLIGIILGAVIAFIL